MHRPTAAPTRRPTRASAADTAPLARRTADPMISSRSRAAHADWDAPDVAAQNVPVERAVQNVPTGGALPGPPLTYEETTHAASAPAPRGERSSTVKKSWARSLSSSASMLSSMPSRPWLAHDSPAGASIRMRSGPSILQRGALTAAVPDNAACNGRPVVSSGREASERRAGQPSALFVGAPVSPPRRASSPGWRASFSAGLDAPIATVSPALAMIASPTASSPRLGARVRPAAREAHLSTGHQARRHDKGRGSVRSEHARPQHVATPPPLPTRDVWSSKRPSSSGSILALPVSGSFSTEPRHFSKKRRGGCP